KCGMGMSDGVLGGCKNIPAHQRYQWLTCSENLLRTVIEFLPLFEGTRVHLLVDQTIDLRLPRRGGMGLRGIPKMQSTARQPNVDIGIRVCVVARSSQHAGVGLFRLRDAVE